MKNEFVLSILLHKITCDSLFSWRFLLISAGFRATVLVSGLLEKAFEFLRKTVVPVLLFFYYMLEYK